MSTNQNLPVHLEGMGAMGALTAYQLYRLGIPFTWHDIEPEESVTEVSPRDYFTAWHASTGAVFPTGEEADIRCLRAYENGLLDAYPVGVFSKNVWVFGAKKPPHKAVGTVYQTVEDLKLFDIPAYNCDVQKLVQYARLDFASRRLSEVEGTARKGKTLYLIAHGWSARQTHVYWGWTRLVRLKMDERLPGNSCFYFRKDRFFITYAYPVGTSGWWYAGSTITKQKSPRSAADRMPKEYARWKKNFEELTGGLAVISEEGPFIEGWRPASGGMHDASPEQYSVDQVGDLCFAFPCRSHDGIRRFPDIFEQIQAIVHNWEESKNV